MEKQSGDFPVEAQKADWAQANDKYLFIAYGDTVVVMNAVTTRVIEEIEVPKLHSCSHIVGMLLIENRLVVIVQEYVSTTQDAGSMSSGASNISVLAYNTADLNLLVKGSLPGRYVDAFRAGSKVHIVTDKVLDFTWLAERFLPSSMQKLTNSSLDEDNYPQLAFLTLICSSNNLPHSSQSDCPAMGL